MLANKDRGTSVGFSKIIVHPTENKLDDIEVEFKNVPVFDDPKFNPNPEPQYPSKDNGYNRGLSKGSYEFSSKGIIELIKESPEVVYKPGNLKMSDIEQGIQDYNKNKAMNTVCKEHEWVSSRYFSHDGDEYEMCRICKTPKPKLTDFHISENLLVINKQGWEDIFESFEKREEYSDPFNFYDYYQFKKFLKENFVAPEKK